MSNGLSASEMDAEDPIASFRSRFATGDKLIYLDGNSLGRMPLAVSPLLDDLKQQWSERLVGGWSEGWMETPRRLGAKIARLIGARPNEVIVADSTSVNFFKLAVAALQARPGRQKIVTDNTNFPSDLYLLQGASDLLGGGRINVSIESPDGIHLPPELIENTLDESTALLTLTHTAFKSGYVHDMQRLTRAARAFGALTLWDLSHSVGAMPLALGDCEVDLAVGCTYKYVNGGPGAPAFLYVREDLQRQLSSPIWGWFGQKNAFDFELKYSPAEGIDRFLAGTPPILSMACMEPGVDLLLEAGMNRVREKSIAMTSFLIELWEKHLSPLGVSLASPRDPRLRGSHVSFGHPEALRIDRALIEEKGVVPDFRRPDNIRFGVAPLYNTFAELEEAVLRMKEVLLSECYLKYSNESGKVT